jgi:hypothetical protein
VPGSIGAVSDLGLPHSPQGLRGWELLQLTDELIRAGRFDHAVISIQTALEIAAEEQLDMLIELHGLGRVGAVITEKLLRPPYNFRDDRFRALWASLTGDEIHRQDWWEAYLLHVKRRNEIVHGGREVTREEANESLRVASEAIRHVNSVSRETDVRLGRQQTAYDFRMGHPIPGGGD